ncbi:MAG: hypothetical protein E7316_04490 [Clostridiales bacterium]|nr:hypothetical protein [Clostridiales bacterium]
MNGLGCGRRGGSGMLATVGVALIAAGLILLFACIPGWAWAALAGLALIVAGYVLIRLEAGR